MIINLKIKVTPTIVKQKNGFKRWNIKADYLYKNNKDILSLLSI